MINVASFFCVQKVGIFKTMQNKLNYGSTRDLFGISNSSTADQCSIQLNAITLNQTFSSSVKIYAVAFYNERNPVKAEINPLPH